MHLHNGFDPPLFTVEEIITHSYSALGINPNLEFAKDGLTSLPLPNVIENGILRGIDFVSNAIGSNPLISTATNAILHNQPFREKYIYTNCTISAPTFGDKPKSETIETLILHASDRTSENDINIYDDSYLPNDIAQQTLRQIDEMTRKLLSERLGIQ